MELNKILKDARKGKGLSQEDLAAKLFVTRQAVSRWENGETTPGLEILKALSETLEIPANTLLGIPEGAVCQSCGMPLKKIKDFGTDAAGSAHTEYCVYCMQKGGFTHERTIDEMIESNLRFLEEFNAENGLSFTPEQARTELKAHLATLKRWKKN